MIQDKVYVVSHKGGVLKVCKSNLVAIIEASDYRSYGYKGVKVEEFNIYQ